MNIAAIGIDLGKSTFHLVALDDTGQVALRRKLTKRKLIDLAGTLPPTLIGMEACGGAHHLGRILREQGHDARIIPAQFVKPFVKSQKNDFSGCRGHCGGGAASEHALCADQDRGANGHANGSSGT